MIEINIRKTFKTRPAAERFLSKFAAKYHLKVNNVWDGSSVYENRLMDGPSTHVVVKWGEHAVGK